MSCQTRQNIPSSEATWRAASLDRAHCLLSPGDQSLVSVMQTLSILAAQLQSISSFFAGSLRPPCLPQRENFEERRKLGPVPGRITCADGLPNQTACFGCADGTILVITPDRSEHKLLLHAGGVAALRAIDEQSFVSSGKNGTILVWQRVNRQRWSARCLQGHNGAVRLIEPLRDGRIVSAGEDGTIRLWECGPISGWSCKIIRSENDPICSLSVSPAGRIIAATCGQRLLISTPESDSSWRHERLSCSAGPATFVRDLPDGRILSGNSDAASMWTPRWDGSWIESTLPRLQHAQPFPDGRVLCADEHLQFGIWTCRADGEWQRDAWSPSSSSFKLTVLAGGEVLEQFGYLDEGDWIELMKVTQFKPDGSTRHYTSYWGRGQELPQGSGKSPEEYDPGFLLSDGGFVLLKDSEALYYNWENPCQS